MPPAASTTNDSGQTPRGTRREVWAWAMYDWAMSAYSTLAISVMVAYYKSVFPGDMGTLLWSFGIGCTAFVAAICSPIGGAIADAHASKRKWLACTALPGAVAAALMFFAVPDYELKPTSWSELDGPRWALVAFFLMANFGYELAQGFYNGFLPEIADDKDMNRVSAWGYALGYIGGGLCLAIVLVLIKFADDIGIPTANAFNVRLGLLINGIWWFVFTLPAVIWLKDKQQPKREPEPFATAARRAAGEVGATLKNVRSYRLLAIFLIGFLVYNEGVQTMITQSSQFAIDEIKMTTEDLIVVILMIQFLAFPGAMIVGYLADQIGQKQALVLTLLIWIGLLIAAYFVTTKTHFYMLAVVVAFVLGGTQSVSRAIMGLMTPENRTAEFFGFFNLSGKATSVVGPMLYGILSVTAGPRVAVFALIGFFLLGLLIVAPLNIAEGQRQARDTEANRERQPQRA